MIFKILVILLFIVAPILATTNSVIHDDEFHSRFGKAVIVILFLIPIVMLINSIT